MGWFIGGGLLVLVLAGMLVIDIRDRNFRPRFNRGAARDGRIAAQNDAMLRSGLPPHGIQGPAAGP